MKLLIAYWTVVAVWTTTPLGIALSNDSLSFWSAATARMLLALPILLLIIAVRRVPFIPNRQTLKVYLVSAMGFGPQVSLVYWASQYVPSGVVSLIFALNPCFIYVMSCLFTSDSRFTWRQCGALAIAVSGLGIIYVDQLQLDAMVARGIGALLVSTLLFAVMTVWLKRLMEGLTLDPVCQCGGTMLFGVPVLLTMWFLFDGEIPQQVSTVSLGAVAYLAVFGSVLGFTLYFYIFTRMNVVTVSLITLITPVFALALGNVVRDEVITMQIAIGAGLVVVGLVIFEDLAPRLLRWFRSKRASQLDHRLALGSESSLE